MATLFGNHFWQVAWVVPDISAAEEYFRDTLGIPRFAAQNSVRARDYAGTYYGQPGDFEFHLRIAWSGQTWIELIQPVSGRSIFQDFLDQYAGPGIHHVAYAVPISDFQAAAAQLTSTGHPMIQSVHSPGLMEVGYFDTSAAAGTVTEIVGLMEAGAAYFEKLKRRAA